MTDVSLQFTSPLHVRVFIASPGDVADERSLALKKLDELNYDPLLRERGITVETVAWDKQSGGTPLLATMTPQEAIAQGLPKPSECDIVVVIFWSRMGTPLPATYTKPDGSRYYSGTEWEYQDAIQAERPGKPVILVYRRTEKAKLDQSDPHFDEKRAQWLKVEEFFDSFKNPDGSIRGGINTYKTPDHFSQQLEHDLKDRLVWLRKRREPAGEANRVKPLSPESELWPDSPFPGLRAFTSKDAPIFFGRGRETDGLIRKLANPSSRFVAIVGASGSGKSSLVRAGLLPRLRDGAIEGSQDWISMRFMPGEVSDDPFLALAATLAPLLERSGSRARDLAAQLKTNPSALAELALTALEGRPDWAELLVVIDQFEELFTLADPRYCHLFIQVLAAAAQAQRIRTVVTLRADFYARCLESPELTELLRAGSYPLAAPGIGALFEMIAKPAARAGLTFDEGLAQRIVDDTGREPGALALMAFALSELYEARESDGRLTDIAYQKFDGVQGAIAQRAEDTFCKLDPDVQAALGNAFQQLVEVDERGIVTRQRAPLRRLEGSVTATLVDALTDARLLVKSSVDGDPVVEVAHEALLTRWPRLAAWIEKTGEDLRLLKQVRLAADEWERQGRREEFLWPDKRLMQVWAMLERLQAELDATEQRFVRPFDQDEVFDELNDLATSHERRASIGDYLARIGDTRSGVGLDDEGLPDIVWCDVPGGVVGLEGDAGTFRMEHFEISQYLITWVQYRTFLTAADGYNDPTWWKEPAYREERPGDQYRRLDNHPAENVSWYDAVAFCSWLTARLGYEVSLPTEWEWQQAATGGSASRNFPWGAEWDSRLANTEESQLNRTTAVGVYVHGASLIGPLDLSGNVWEWCLNEYLTPEQTGETGDRPRAVRGGSFLYKSDSARVTHRERDLPNWRNLGHGFRVVRRHSAR